MRWRLHGLTHSGGHHPSIAEFRIEEGSTVKELEARVAELEEKVRVLTDALELQTLMARYGPAVDSGSADAAADLWAEDGVYDSDGAAPMHGADAVREMVNGPKHQSLLPNCAHTIGPAVLDVAGDRAAATGYSRVYLRDGDAFNLWRLAANRWDFARTASGWKVARRTNRLLGTDDAHELLRRGATPDPKP